MSGTSNRDVRVRVEIARRHRRSNRARLMIMAVVLLLSFAAVSGRLIALGLKPHEMPSLALAQERVQHALARPDIVDRHGRLLATDISVYWVYADPKQVINVDEAAERLARVLPDLNTDKLRQMLSQDSRFVWVQRGLTPKQAERVHHLGLPGIGMFTEPRRVYPSGPTVAHVLGYTDVDNHGLAGLERYIDQTPGLAQPPQTEGGRPYVRVALDLGVQHTVHEELVEARARFGAKAAGGLVMDVISGEVISLVSLPDYDPNHREESLKPGHHNRIVVDAYELGSVFKAFTVAMAIDRGVVKLDDRYDVKTPLKVDGFTLTDTHARQQYMTVPEIFIHSSNTGAARIAQDVSGYWQRDFFKRIGLLDRPHSELEPGAAPLLPDIWRDVNTVTAAYGHGIAVSPLAFAAGAAALVNGGYLVAPTFLPRTRREGRASAKKVMRSRTSDIMRKLLHLNVQKGTGRQAAVPGYRVGGKTGTAQKPGPGGYQRDKVISTFFAAFPMDDPQYLVMVMLDEPQPTEAAHRRTEAAWNAAPTVGGIIKRIAPMLGIAPDHAFDEIAFASY